MKKLFVIVGVTLLVGCAGKFDYVRPTAPASASNVVIMERPRDAVWDSSVPELGKRFFTINNLDKSSGLINVSYTGDPEQYVDCGQITSYVKNARGERTYQFAGSKAQQSYEIMDSNGLFSIQRRMSLEGRVNLIFEDAGPNKTRVTANTRYVVTKQVNVHALANNTSQSASDTIAFNTGGSASFPPNNKGQATECVSTGRLEHDILSAIR